MEVLKNSVKGEEDDDDNDSEGIELSLELSIGGSYGRTEKSKKPERKTEEDSCREIEKGHPDFTRFCFGAEENEESGSDFVKSQTKREIQALRRQEARKKREEKLKNSLVSKGGLNGFAGTENKSLMEAKQFQIRVQDREKRENENLLGDSVHKKEEKNNNFHDLSLSLNQNCNKIHGSNVQQYPYPSVPYVAFANGFAYPCVVPYFGSQGEVLNGGNVVCHTGNSGQNCSSECGSEQSDGKNACGNQSSSLELSSSVSGLRSTPQKGSGTLDNRSHSSHMLGHQAPCSSTVTGNVLKQQEISASPPQAESQQAHAASAKNTVKEALANMSLPAQITPENSKPESDLEPANDPCSKSKDVTSPPHPIPLRESNGINIRSPISASPPDVVSPSQVPYVSTTGNGPNGKTIRGILYRYSKSEVSIMCVCHGSSFSPAEFVEHAGGVDIKYPLRHITMLPPAFG